MPAELICFEERCRARFPITEVIYNCPHCGGLLEVWYPPPAAAPAELKRIWRERRTSNAPLDQSGVWRYREIIPFLESYDRVVTLREGHTPLLPAPPAAGMAAWTRLRSSTRDSIPPVPSKTTV
jgi:threonine synthase